MDSLLLLSGGLDSAVILHTVSDIKLCVGFDYGQGHLIELEKAQQLAAKQGVEYLRIPLHPLPKVNDVVFTGRNAVMLATAAAIAQARGIPQVIIGCNQSDSERFPDCRPEFIRGANQCLAAYGVNIYAPLLRKTKREVVEVANSVGIMAHETWTCYQPKEGIPCGTCYACKGLEAAYVQG